MPKTNSLLAFVEKQEILNNIQTSITKIYADDPSIHEEGFLEELTLKTLDVIEHMDTIYSDMLENNDIVTLAKQLKVPADDIVKDVIDLMLYTTIARQHMVIDNMYDKD